jgi:hypothetical protein
MIHCTDLIHALELYRRGYGDRSSIHRLLALAHRTQEDPRSFAWQRAQLGALITAVEASLGIDSQAEAELLAAQRMAPLPSDHSGLR